MWNSAYLAFLAVFTSASAWVQYERAGELFQSHLTKDAAKAVRERAMGWFFTAISLAFAFGAGVLL